MSTTPSDPGFDFKHRITGAVILILFAVIVLPMILGGPNPDLLSAGPAPAPGAPDSKVFVSKITPIGGATPERRPAPGAEKTPVAERGASNGAIASDASKAAKPGPDAAEKPAPAAAPAAKPKSSSKPAAEPVLDRGWIVQVGVFSQADNAERMSALLRKRGFKPESDAIEANSKQATRVWIGPFAKRVDAARMRARLEQATGEKGYIVAYP